MMDPMSLRHPVGGSAFPDMKNSDFTYERHMYEYKPVFVLGYCSSYTTRNEEYMYAPYIHHEYIYTPFAIMNTYMHHLQ